MSKINKALDFNKLLEAQKEGKLLGKFITYPVWASIKYDGNYATVRVYNGRTTFTTSGGLNYIHTDNGGDIFLSLPNGVYIAERIAGKGLLGDRRRCNLRGPKSAQTSTGHSYIIHDYMYEEDYNRGSTYIFYNQRRKWLLNNIPIKYLPIDKLVHNKGELDAWLKEVVRDGYEGIMGKDGTWQWKDTKSRTINNFKYKKRPTADLICIGTEEGEGKYEGLIGSLTLKDSDGRIVNVGSGLSDSDRNCRPSFYFGLIVEIEYEQIMDTYIQPTFIGIRRDKTKEDID